MGRTLRLDQRGRPGDHPEPAVRRGGGIQADLLTGVIWTELNLADLSNILQTLKISRTGLAVVINRGGQLVATSVEASLAESDLQRVAASRSDRPEVRALARAVGRGNLDAELRLSQASELVEVSTEFNSMTWGCGSF